MEGKGEELNNQIFEQIKSLLSSGIGGNDGSNAESLNNSLLYKICNGQATESEIDEWNKTMPINDDKIKESCNLGYTLASKLDVPKIDELQSLRDEMIEMKKEIEFLKTELVRVNEKVNEKVDLKVNKKDKPLPYTPNNF